MSYYETIKDLAREHKLPVTSFIALAPQNDPFYVGSPGQSEWAHWFAGLWRKLGYEGSQSVHLRRIHYRVISQATPVIMPDGKPYENTEGCWGRLSTASKHARYLHLVDAADFDDRRNPEPTDYAPELDTDPRFYVNPNDWYFTGLPDFPTAPAIELSGFDAQQRYHIEIWCEKSTMNDVLEPLAARYGATLQIGVGELSLTRVYRLAQRLNLKGQPTQIFYISDFDPAGKSMPVAVARKLEWVLKDLKYPVDVSLTPLVLTEDQCANYSLPRTPIKDTEKRAARFEERFGSGATELDALEALYPGELQRIIEEAIEPYFDWDLDSRVEVAREEVESVLDERRGNVLDRHREELDALQGEYRRLKDSITAQVESIDDRRKALWHSIADELRDNAPDINDFLVPQAEHADEPPTPPMFHSLRGYGEQIGYYKDFQGK